MKTKISFSGRTAIITGAGRGLGKLYAKAFAERGANVLVNDTGTSLDGSGNDSSVAEVVVKEIKQAGGSAEACFESAAEVKGGERIVEAAMDAFGRIDILINNAGILRDRSFLKMTESEWDNVIAVHLKSAFAVTKPALIAMKTNNYGRIVFTSSASGLFGTFGQTNYGAAKMGIIGLMNSLKLENEKADIKVNAIAPFGLTRMTQNVYPDELKDMMDPTFNVPPVLYLASEQNKETGVIICAKGGWYARAAVVCSKGITFDTDNPITPEDIANAFSDITNLQEALPLKNAAETIALVKRT